MKVVLDTNSLLQIVFPRARYKEVWDALIGQKYTICLTNDILMEYREILERRFNDVQFAENVIEAILSMPNIEHVNPTYRFNLITTDPDDNKFVDCAIVASADYLVSEDNHFNVLKDIPFPKVNVITLEQFQNDLQSQK